jgi:eukaryotic-like serine/threonine-protein kinase
VVGRTVSHYRIVSHLGGGGMGVVYCAEDTRLGRDVAIKFLPNSLSSDVLSLERFRREARVASRINHPHICTVYDIGEYEQQPFLVMELLEGETLKGWIGRGRVPLPDLLKWSAQFCEALDAAHLAGIIHRDVKPANLFITTRGETKILDFGLARPVSLHRASVRLHSGRTETMVDFETSPGSAVGTVAYMSPEQARGEELDRRTDIFSLGIVMYEMATGEAPFHGGTTAVIFDAILNREPAPVQERNSTLPPELGRIIQKALDKNRDLRYQHVAELRADLQRLQDNSSIGRQHIPGPRPVTSQRRSRTRIYVAGLVLLLLAVATAALFIGIHRPQPTKELVPIRVTSNGTDVPIESMDLSPDGKYLAFSDGAGVHIRSVETGDARILPDTKGMSVEHWSSNGTQFFVSQLSGTRYICHSISLPGGVPHLVGDAVPSPSGRYALTLAPGHEEVRREREGKVYSLHRKGIDILRSAWSPRERRLAVTYLKQGIAIWAEALDLETGHWTTLIPAEKYGFGPMVWTSESRLVCARGETPPRSDMNLWTLEIDPSTGRISEDLKRRTGWTDFQIDGLGITADASRLSILRTSVQSDIFIGNLQANAGKLVSLRKFTKDDAFARPIWWTSDNRTLLFDSDRDGKKQIYKQHIDKDTADLLTSGNGYQFGPRQSPDGLWVLYVSGEELPSGLKSRLMRVPLAGGSPEQVLELDGYVGYSCSRVRGGICALAETRAGLETLSVFDPESGQRRRISEITTGMTGAPDVSPDGKHVAFIMSGSPRNHIRIVNLQGATELEITVAEAQNIRPLKWTPDGNGFFTTDMQPSRARLLHVRRNGKSQVLFEQAGNEPLWGVPSPDGLHLAIYQSRVNGNVWMVDNP